VKHLGEFARYGLALAQGWSRDRSVYRLRIQRLFPRSVQFCPVECCAALVLGGKPLAGALMFWLYRLVWLGLEGIQEHTRGRERIGVAGAFHSGLLTIFCHQDWPHSWSRLPMCEGYTSLVDPVKNTKTAIEHFAYN
jgi:hypothetical protein